MEGVILYKQVYIVHVEGAQGKKPSPTTCDSLVTNDSVWLFHEISWSRMVPKVFTELTKCLMLALSVMSAGGVAFLFLAWHSMALVLVKTY